MSLPQTSPPTSTGSVKMVYGGDLFSAPPRSILIHACNTVGSWRSGVAFAFRNLYPSAHRVYTTHCTAHAPAELIGTTLLIAPQPGDKNAHWVACLFTSVSYGKDVDPPAAVIENTALAVADLRRQVEVLEVSGAEIGEWHSAKINSVRFKVPWGGTVAVLEREAGREVVVYEFDEKAVE